MFTAPLRPFICQRRAQTNNDPTMTDQRPQSIPAIAIVSNSQTPYRLHVHQRIARELPQIRLWSLFTHETSNAPWAFSNPEEIGPVLFGKGESSDQQAKPKNILREWRRGGRIIRWMKEHDIRFVLMMGYNDAGRMRMIRWCHRRHIPCWLFGDSNIRGDLATGLKAVIKKIVVRRVVAQCDGIFSCGTLGRDYFAKYGADPDRCFFYPYEPDYHLIQGQSPAAIEQVGTRWSLAKDRRRIVFSGRLAQVKRPELLMAAFIAISEQRPNWDLLMIGDGPLRQLLQNQLPPALTDRVKWTGFIDDQAAIGALYRLSDLLVLPSDYEPWALVINEAASAGLAIVSSNVVGAAAELVRDGVNGRLFPPGDLAALTECLLDATNRIDEMKAQSSKILADWRSRGDPVQGLRAALIASGVIGK
jgi:glycosyltransferase involved in cell wall biosynthesis